MKTSISIEELKNFLAINTPLFIIDVRTREEFNLSHIPMAGNLGIEIIEDGLFIPEPGKIVITVCGKGAGRSERAAAWLRKQCNTEAYFLEGGTSGWNLQKSDT